MMQWTSGMRTGDRVTDKKMAETFEYLFVDMEWNQTPGTKGIEDREPVQIGIVATDEQLQVMAEIRYDLKEI